MLRIRRFTNRISINAFTNITTPVNGGCDGSNKNVELSTQNVDLKEMSQTNRRIRFQHLKNIDKDERIDYFNEPTISVIEGKRYK
jgi:hypothetical protein